MYLTTSQSEKKKTSSEEVKQFIKSLREYKSVDEVVAYLFAAIDKTEITADDDKLHTAFFNLQKKHSKMLEGLTFTCGQIFPFSIDLQNAIFNLQKSDLMEAPNPSYEYHLIKTKDKEIIKSDLSELFSEEEKKELVLMAEELKVSIEHGVSKAGKRVG